MFGDEEMLPVEDEIYDFSDAGVEERELEFAITDYDIEEKENGKRALITFKSDELGFPVVLRLWTEHTNPKAQAIGRSQIRKIALAALGTERFSRTTLIGSRVKATTADDGNGFTTLKKFKTADEEPVVAE